MIIKDGSGRGRGAVGTLFIGLALSLLSVQPAAGTTPAPPTSTSVAESTSKAAADPLAQLTTVTKPVAGTPASPAGAPLAIAPSAKVTPSVASSSERKDRPVADAPQLSIAVDNGRTSAKPGESLTYVLTVTNMGTTDVSNLRLTQSLPEGVALVKADTSGRHTGNNVAWRLNLKAGKAATFHVTLKVSATPKDLLRLATVACATLPGATAPIVCASHSDQLPAGAAADAATIRSSAVPVANLAGPTPGAAGHTWWYVGAAALLLIIAAAVVLLLRRRRALAPAEEAPVGASS